MKKIKGLIAAAFSPMNPDGSISTGIIPRITDYLIDHSIDGLYVCGSTGEGPLLSVEERKQIARGYIDAAGGRIPVIVHVGHDSLPEAQVLARHAASAGADAIAAVGPCYFKASSTRQLIAYLAKIAEVVPHLPFYYYHIPHLSGNNLDMIEFLQESAELIPSLKGIKYSALTVYEFQSCKELFEGRYDVFFGCDEMLTSGLSAGADSAIGSTYNLAGRLYRRIMESFAQGDIETARKLQYLSVQMVRLCYTYRGLPAFKAVMKLLGLDCGPVRLPLQTLTNEEFKNLTDEIKTLGIWEWFFK
jgi:N-acetylneuraminate lyase